MLCHPLLPDCVGRNESVCDSPAAAAHAQHRDGQEQAGVGTASLPQLQAGVSRLNPRHRGGRRWGRWAGGDQQRLRHGVLGDINGSWELAIRTIPPRATITHPPIYTTSAGSRQPENLELLRSIADGRGLNYLTTGCSPGALALLSISSQILLLSLTAAKSRLCSGNPRLSVARNRWPSLALSLPRPASPTSRSKTGTGTTLLLSKDNCQLPVSSIPASHVPYLQRGLLLLYIPRRTYLALCCALSNGVFAGRYLFAIALAPEISSATKCAWLNRWRTTQRDKEF